MEQIRETCRKCGRPVPKFGYILERRSVWHVGCHEPEEERWVMFHCAEEDKWACAPSPEDEEDD